MPKVTRIVLRTGASAASLGAFAMGKTAELLRGLAGEEKSPAPGPDSRADVPVEHRGEARNVEPVVAPDKAPSNPAAPAGGDAEGTSGTGPVPRQISKPKAARKVRKRQAAAGSVKRLEAKGQAKGAKPSTASKAEPSPAELARTGAGRQPAPMGSSSTDE